MKPPRSVRQAGEDRAVSELLGAVLVFALLVLLLVLAQVTLVPALNQQVEFEHSQRVSDDFGDLQASSSRVASTGVAEQTALELGVNYPNRPLLLNPGPVQGRIQARPVSGGLTLANVAVPSNAETDEYWDTDQAPSTLGVYDTSVLTYEAQYNEFGNPGRVYVEGGVASFTRYPSADVDAGGSLVDGRRINLVVFAGDFQRSTDGSATVDLAPVSGPTRTLSVTDGDGPITITVQTFLAETQWEQRLDGEPFASLRSYTESGSPDTPNTLVVELTRGETYELRMAQIGVGTGTDRTEAAYLTRAVGSASVVPTNGGQVAVDVRDAFNNPVAGATVTFTMTDGRGTLAADGTSGQSVDADSGADGRATATLSGSDGSVELTATIETGDAAGTQPHETVVFDVQVGDGGDGGGGGGGGGGGIGGELNPNADREFVLTESRFYGCNSGGNNCDGVDVTFTANGVARTLSEMRVNFYASNSPGNSQGAQVDTATLTRESFLGGTSTTLSTPIDMTVTGPYADASTLTTVPADGVVTYRMAFEQVGGGAFDPESGDTFAITVRFAGSPPSQNTYIINPYPGTSGSGPAAPGGTTNSPPSADAGGPYTVDERNALTLDGSASSDADGSVVSYEWSRQGGGPASVSDPDTTDATATFTAPNNVNRDTTFTVVLTVTDEDGATATETATVTVRDR
jgi:hypothetical protein